MLVEALRTELAVIRVKEVIYLYATGFARRVHP